LKKEIEETIGNKLDDIDRLKESITRPKKVLHLADNAGEKVFDRLFLEELLKHNVEVTYAVKGGPILNDATFRDAEIGGIKDS
jgi:uncharacterized protein with ATP-grasp and redox domains